MIVALIQLRGVRKEYPSGPEGAVEALRGVDLDVEQGEFVAIVGPSGGGKSTLLSVLGLLDTLTSGSYVLAGAEVRGLGERQLTALRARQFGFVFQSFHLLDRRPVRDSVGLGLLYQGASAAYRRARSDASLARVGLLNKSEASANTLSGGQQQRVAIARAMATGNPVVLADEPTGNLDGANSRRVLDELCAIHSRGATVVVVTHSEQVAARAQRVVRIEDGRIVSQTRRAEVRAAPSPALASLGRLSTGAVVTDAMRSAASRARATAALITAVAIAVAFMVLTLGLAAAAEGQVSDAFDANENKEVSANWASGSGPNGADLRDRVARVQGLAGVNAAAGLVDHGKIGVAAERGAAPPVTVDAPLHAVTGDFASATGSRVSWASPGARFLPPGTALLGRSLAERLQLAPLPASPVVVVSGAPLTVVGLVEESSRYPLLAGEVITSLATADALAPAAQSSIAIRTANGAAPQVGRQAAAAIDPFDPKSIAVQVPTDPASLRQQVQSGVQIALGAFTALAAIVAVVTLANAISMSVIGRTGEFGLRRAVGARGRHLALLVTAEAAMIGLIGGIGGLFIGMLALLGFSIARGWLPTFDARLAPLGIAAGVLLAVASSVVGALRAARLKPATALRS